MTDDRDTPEPAADAPIALAWRTGLAGCLLPVVVGAFLLFFYWAANPGSIDPQDYDGRGGWIVEAAAAFSGAGVGWGFLLIASALLSFAGQLVWRVIERVAVRADARGVRLCGPFGRFVPWRGVRQVRFSIFPNPPSLEIVFAEPQPAPFNPLRRVTVRLAGVAHQEGEAAAFADAAEALRLAAGDAPVPHAPTDLTPL